VTTTVTVELERDSEGKLWLYVRCACHGWQLARRETKKAVMELLDHYHWSTSSEAMASTYAQMKVSSR
jgi:hypothetical protein